MAIAGVILGILGVLACILIPIFVVYDINQANNKAKSAALQERVQAWASGYGNSAITDFDSDITHVDADLVHGQTQGKLDSDCDTYLAYAQSYRGYPPIPDATLNRQWQAILAHAGRIAQECLSDGNVASAANLGSAQARDLLGEFKEAKTQIDGVGVALGSG